MHQIHTAGDVRSVKCGAKCKNKGGVNFLIFSEDSGRTEIFIWLKNTETRPDRSHFGEIIGDIIRILRFWIGSLDF